MIGRRRIVATVLAVGLLAAACSGGQDTSGQDTSGQDTSGQDTEDAVEAAGPPVPDRTYETFDGETTSLAAFDAPMVVNFFASWCPPCVAEMPDFERVHLDVRDEVRFVGINTQDNLAAARDLVVQTGVTYDLGLDPQGALFRDFGGIAMPSTFFVDADGTVVHRHAGLLTEQQLRDLVDEHLTS